jgi:hypothetical protein
MLGERYGWAKVGFDKHLDASFQRAIEAGHAWVEHYTDRRCVSCTCQICPPIGSTKSHFAVSPNWRYCTRRCSTPTWPSPRRFTSETLTTRIAIVSVTMSPFATRYVCTLGVGCGDAWAVPGPTV